VPFVRFARDKRGYEYVYLVHDSTRGSRSSRPVVLYWYRTPPGVKVGRPPFDEEVRQRLEAQNPEIRFDWRAITSAQPPPPDAEHWRERRRVEKAAKLARMQEERDETAPRDSADLIPDDAVADGAVEDTAGHEELGDDTAIVSALEPQEAGENAAAATGEPLVAGAAPADRAPHARARRWRRGRRRKHPAGGPAGAPASPQAASVDAPAAAVPADRADPEETSESAPQEPEDS